jgi:NitT/TauT family transport system substrate-binding protein
MHTSAFHRRTFVVASVLALAGVAPHSLRAQGKPEKTKVSLLVDGEAALCHLPLTVADQLGYFKAEGVELEISDTVGGARSPLGGAGAAVDVFAGAFEQTIHSQARNQFHQSFVLQGRTPQVALGVSTRNMPDYQSPADLRGRRIGVIGLGAPSQTVANMLLQQAGVPAAEVHFVPVSAGMGALLALRSGLVDALSSPDPVMGMLEQKGEVKIVADTRSLKATLALFGAAMPGVGLSAPLEFIRKNPNTVQALSNAMVHGLKWLQTAGPSDIIKIVPESYFLGDRALYLAAFNKAREAISTDGLLPEDGPKTAWKALASFDPTVRASKIDLAKTYTNEFARRAKERFKA